MSDTKSIYSIISEIIYDSDTSSIDSDERLDNFIETIRNFQGLDLMDKSPCLHNWEQHKGLDETPCFKCKMWPSLDNRAKCLHCRLEICKFCLEQYFGYLWDKPQTNIEELEVIAVRKRYEALELRLKIQEEKINQVQKELRTKPPRPISPSPS